MQTTYSYRYIDSNEAGYRGYENVKKERVKAPAKKEILSAKDKSRVLMLTLIAGVLGVCIIISVAFCATLQHQINTLTAANSEIEKEIQEVNVTLQTENSMAALEKKAKNDLGMTYPKSSQIVYINDIVAPGDFEATAKDEAYN